MSRAADRALRSLSRAVLDMMAAEAGTEAPDSVASLAERRRVCKAFQAAHGLGVDGHPGDGTLGKLWALNKPSRALVEARLSAAEAMGGGTVYKLGNGGWGWFESELAPQCDCSGLIAHALQRPRTPQSDFMWHGTEWWWSTESMWADAIEHERILRRIPEPIDGCIAVYPDSDGKQGHTGYIASVQGNQLMGWDCSSSQYRNHKDAIRYRDLTFFRRKSATVYAVPVWWPEGGA